MPTATASSLAPSEQRVAIELVTARHVVLAVIVVFVSRASRLFALLKSLDDQAAGKRGIPISSLNPDTNGDGNVAKWEAETYERIQKADVDKSGSINTKELFTVIKGAAIGPKTRAYLDYHEEKGDVPLYDVMAV